MSPSCMMKWQWDQFCGGLRQVIIVADEFLKAMAVTFLEDTAL